MVILFLAMLVAEDCLWKWKWKLKEKRTGCGQDHSLISTASSAEVF